MEDTRRPLMQLLTQMTMPACRHIVCIVLKSQSDTGKEKNLFKLLKCCSDQCEEAFHV